MTTRDADTETELRRLIRQFLDRECSVEEVHRRYTEATPPVDLMARLGELGLLRLGLPKPCGGDGSVRDLAVLHEELGRRFIDLGHLAGRVTYLASAIGTFGSAVQRERWLEPLLEGQVIGSLSYTEPDAGSDLFSLRTRAEPSPGGYRITGRKVFSSSFGYADVSIVAAKVGDPGPREPITMFLVDPQTEGVGFRKLDTLGHPCDGTFEVTFDDVEVGDDQRLGELGTGRTVMAYTLGRERLLMAARAVGQTDAVLQLCARHLLDREQFGKPLSEFQALRHKLADVALAVDVGRSAVERLADDLDAGRDDPQRSAATKIFTTENLVRAADEGVQLFGGYGYVASDMQRLYRDARVYTIGGGTSEVLRDVIARSVLRSAASR